MESPSDFEIVGLSHSREYRDALFSRARDIRRAMEALFPEPADGGSAAAVTGRKQLAATAAAAADSCSSAVGGAGGAVSLCDAVGTARDRVRQTQDFEERRQRMLEKVNREDRFTSNCGVLCDVLGVDAMRASTASGILAAAEDLLRASYLEDADASPSRSASVSATVVNSAPAVSAAAAAAASSAAAASDAATAATGDGESAGGVGVAGSEAAAAAAASGCSPGEHEGSGTPAAAAGAGASAAAAMAGAAAGASASSGASAGAGAKESEAEEKLLKKIVLLERENAGLKKMIARQARDVEASVGKTMLVAEKMRQVKNDVRPLEEMHAKQLLVDVDGLERDIRFYQREREYLYSKVFGCDVQKRRSDDDAEEAAAAAAAAAASAARGASAKPAGKAAKEWEGEKRMLVKNLAKMTRQLFLARRAGGKARAQGQLQEQLAMERHDEDSVRKRKARRTRSRQGDLDGGFSSGQQMGTSPVTISLDGDGGIGDSRRLSSSEEGGSEWVTFQNHDPMFSDAAAALKVEVAKPVQRFLLSAASSLATIERLTSRSIESLRSHAPEAAYEVSEAARRTHNLIVDERHAFAKRARAFSSQLRAAQPSLSADAADDAAAAAAAAAVPAACAETPLEATASMQTQTQPLEDSKLLDLAALPPELRGSASGTRVDRKLLAGVEGFDVGSRCPACCGLIHPDYETDDGDGGGGGGGCDDDDAAAASSPAALQAGVRIRRRRGEQRGGVDPAEVEALVMARVKEVIAEQDAAAAAALAMPEDEGEDEDDDDGESESESGSGSNGEADEAAASAGDGSGSVGGRRRGRRALTNADGTRRRRKEVEKEAPAMTKLRKRVEFLESFIKRKNKQIETNAVTLHHTVFQTLRRIGKELRVPTMFLPQKHTQKLEVGHVEKFEHLVSLLNEDEKALKKCGDILANANLQAMARLRNNVADVYERETGGTSGSHGTGGFQRHETVRRSPRPNSQGQPYDDLTSSVLSDGTTRRQTPSTKPPTPADGGSDGRTMTPFTNNTGGYSRLTTPAGTGAAASSSSGGSVAGVEGAAGEDAVEEEDDDMMSCGSMPDGTPPSEGDILNEMEGDGDGGEDAETDAAGAEAAAAEAAAEEAPPPLSPGAKAKRMRAMEGLQRDIRTDKMVYTMQEGGKPGSGSTFSGYREKNERKRRYKEFCTALQGCQFAEFTTFFVAYCSSAMGGCYVLRKVIEGVEKKQAKPVVGTEPAKPVAKCPSCGKPPTSTPYCPQTGSSHIKTTQRDEKRNRWSQTSSPATQATVVQTDPVRPPSPVVLPPPPPPPPPPEKPACASVACGTAGAARLFAEVVRAARGAAQAQRLQQLQDRLAAADESEALVAARLDSLSALLADAERRVAAAEASAAAARAEAVRVAAEAAAARAELAVAELSSSFKRRGSGGGSAAAARPFRAAARAASIASLTPRVGGGGGEEEDAASDVRAFSSFTALQQQSERDDAAADAAAAAAQKQQQQVGSKVDLATLRKQQTRRRSIPEIERKKVAGPSRPQVFLGGVVSSETAAAAAAEEEDRAKPAPKAAGPAAQHKQAEQRSPFVKPPPAQQDSVPLFASKRYPGTGTVKAGKLAQSKPPAAAAAPVTTTLGAAGPTTGMFGQPSLFQKAQQQPSLGGGMLRTSEAPPAAPAREPPPASRPGGNAVRMLTGGALGSDLNIGTSPPAPSLPQPMRREQEPPPPPPPAPLPPPPPPALVAPPPQATEVAAQLSPQRAPNGPAEQRAAYEAHRRQQNARRTSMRGGNSEGDPFPYEGGPAFSLGTSGRSAAGGGGSDEPQASASSVRPHSSEPAPGVLPAEALQFPSILNQRGKLQLGEAPLPLAGEAVGGAAIVPAMMRGKHHPMLNPPQVSPLAIGGVDGPQPVPLVNRPTTVPLKISTRLYKATGSKATVKHKMKGVRATGHQQVITDPEDLRKPRMAKLQEALESIGMHL